MKYLNIPNISKITKNCNFKDIKDDIYIYDMHIHMCNGVFCPKLITKKKQPKRNKQYEETFHRNVTPCPRNSERMAEKLTR